MQDRIYRQYVLEAMRSSERLRNSVSGNANAVAIVRFVEAPYPSLYCLPG